MKKPPLNYIKGRSTRKIFFVFAIIYCAGLSGCIQKADRNDIVVAFYNCENFFDTVHNPDKEDGEFTPGGKCHYTPQIYAQKLHNIATVVQSIGDGSGPALMGLAEVENSTVLHDLTLQPEIARKHYKYEWYDGPDPRGINVALLYDPAAFRVLGSAPLHVDLSGVNRKSTTRDILYVHGILAGDTVDVFVNHWPSRRGGEDESIPRRVIAAGVLKNALAALGRDAKVIVMGDFNDNPDDASITRVLGAKGSQSDVAGDALYDPWADMYKNGLGTEVYRHHWNLFDQIMVSGTFLEDHNHKLHYGKAEIYKPGFITDHYKGHEGEPHRSFAGTHWINGYSDHFPVLVDLEK